MSNNTTHDGELIQLGRASVISNMLEVIIKCTDFMPSDFDDDQVKLADNIADEVIMLGMTEHWNLADMMLVIRYIYNRILEDDTDVEQALDEDSGYGYIHTIHERIKLATVTIVR